MDHFSSIVTSIDALIWSMPLVLLCLGVGLFLSLRMGFPQIRLFGDMIRLLAGKEGLGKKDKGSKEPAEEIDKRVVVGDAAPIIQEQARGISGFQAFATTVGARVGMGNIAGIASAIYFGGPGAILWMWIIAIIGAASSMVEAILGQAFKERDTNGVYVGGPAYYIQKGLKCKPYAILFAFIAFLGPGLLLPGVQINSLTLVFEEAFGVNRIIVGAVCCIFLAFVVMGSIKRIAKLAEIIAPMMCLVYIALAAVIIALHITELPSALAVVVQSALGMHAVFGAIIGSAISWGVKRGIYSNEAGMGCGAIVSAAAECSHPAKQGLIQACSIYADTLVIGTATALMIILTGTFDVIGNGGVLLVAQTGGIEAGIKWTQFALSSTFGNWCGQLLAIIIVLFVFTSLTGYCYQAESNVNYLSNGNKAAIVACRIIFVAASFIGAIVSADAVWALGDIGYGLMGWANIIAILIMSPLAFRILRDYEKQRKAGEDPMFHPEEFGIEDSTGAWDVNKGA